MKVGHQTQQLKDMAKSILITLAYSVSIRNKAG